MNQPARRAHTVPLLLIAPSGSSNSIEPSGILQGGAE